MYYGGPKGTCCKSKNCCNFKIVAANFQNELQGYKEFYNFEREAVILFSWPVCDYSDKFPKMFCSLCGMECRSTANFCHLSCQQLNLSQVSSLIMCTSDCVSGCFKVLWCISSLILGASD